MGQVVMKASDEWVHLNVEVDGKGWTKTVYMCACIKPICLSIYIYNSRDGTSSMSGHTTPAIHRDFVNNVRPFISWKEDEVMV
ncbi:unnamed protein product [Sphagnum balticum]